MYAPVTRYTVAVAADGSYTRTVAAYDGVGNTSAYAAIWSFTVETEVRIYFPIVLQNL